MGKDIEGGKEKGMVGSSPGEYACWVLCPEAFVPLLQAGILGSILGEGFSRIFISFPSVLH